MKVANTLLTDKRVILTIMEAPPMKSQICS